MKKEVKKGDASEITKVSFSRQEQEILYFKYIFRKEKKTK